MAAVSLRQGHFKRGPRPRQEGKSGLKHAPHDDSQSRYGDYTNLMSTLCTALLETLRALGQAKKGSPILKQGPSSRNTARFSRVSVCASFHSY